MMLWKVKRKYISKLKSLAYLNNTIYPWTCLRDQTWRPRRLEEVQEEDTSGGHFVLLVHYKLCFLHAHLWYKVRKVPMNKENKHVFFEKWLIRQIFWSPRKHSVDTWVKVMMVPDLKCCKAIQIYKHSCWRLISSGWFRQNW